MTLNFGSFLDSFRTTLIVDYISAITLMAGKAFNVAHHDDRLSTNESDIAY